jgi:predicted regulator of Ras-like GTPase activity (Roadblock/LC7/MglB family)
MIQVQKRASGLVKGDQMVINSKVVIVTGVKVYGAQHVQVSFRLGGEAEYAMSHGSLSKWRNKMKYGKVMILDVRVESDLYVAGRTEDGGDYTAEVFLVCAEFENGEVYAHVQRFKGCKVEQVETEDDSFTAFIDIREEQKAKAERLAQRVRVCIESGRHLDQAFWAFHRTVYGSTAYLAEVQQMTPGQRAGEPD